MAFSDPGPYEPTGAYKGDHLRAWIVAAGEWKAEAVRLAARVRELESQTRDLQGRLEYHRDNAARERRGL